MGDISGVSVFLPYKVLDDLSYAFLYGYSIQNGACVYLNSVVSVKTDKNSNDLFGFHKFFNEKFYFEANLQFTGFIYASKKKLKIIPQILESHYKHMWFILRVDFLNNSFHLEKYHSHEDYPANFIFYDSFELLNSSLLFPIMDLDNKRSLISFLVSTLKKEPFSSLSFNSKHDKYKIISFASAKKSCDSCFNLTAHIRGTFQFIEKIYTTFWFFPKLLKLVRLSHVGRQIHQRALHVGRIIVDLETENTDLERKNIAFSILFDAVFGWLITFFILKLDLPYLFLENTIHYTNNIVNGLQMLIFWLMGVPAGLKLNIPLNSALGHFFLYHIYLWEAYITIIMPVFQVVLKISSFIGVFGLTFVLALFSDVISLASIHIFCFYGYATRLYGYQISCLSALWRLFRGRKWNPLRQRVDSYSYDVHQLYLGTLLFTVLLFLLPTVLVYYLVFMGLRVIVLTVQGLFSKIIDNLSVLPLYSLTLRLLNSPATNGDIYFSVFSSEATLIMSMKLIQMPVISVIQSTLPKIQKYGKIIGWKKLISNILTGEIIYPL